MPRDLAVNAAKPRYPWVLGESVGTCAWLPGSSAHSLDSAPARGIHRPSGQDPNEHSSIDDRRRDHVAQR